VRSAISRGDLSAIEARALGRSLKCPFGASRTSNREVSASPDSINAFGDSMPLELSAIIKP
jgi:hypothetical protein